MCKGIVDVVLQRQECGGGEEGKIDKECISRGKGGKGAGGDVQSWN